MTQNKVDPYALPTEYSQSESSHKEDDTSESDENTVNTDNSSSSTKEDFPQFSPQVSLNAGHSPNNGNAKDVVKARRVSFNTDTIFEPATPNNNTPGTLMPSELDNPLPSGAFPDPSNIDLLPLNVNMNFSLSPTNLESLPDYVPTAIPTLDLADPTILPDLPRLPAFNFHSSSERRVSNPAPRFNISSNQIPDLTSVTDILISDGLENSANLPQIPSQSTIEPLILAPESASDSPGSSGNLPQIVPRVDMEINVDGLPIRNCRICDRPVEFDGLFSNGNYFHKTCAKCLKCGLQLQAPQGAFYKDKLHCIACLQKMEKVDMCEICSLPLDGFQKKMAVNGVNIHTNCLSCFECSRSLAKGQQESLKGKIFCKRCAQVAKQRVCTKCNEFVIGSYVKHHKKFYHPNHFQCTVCNILMHGNNYIIHHNRIYCSKCGQYFSQHCAFCKRALYLTDELLLRWNGKLYHKVCFVCRVCGCELLPDRAKPFHQRPHCEICWGKRKNEFAPGGKSNHKHVIQPTAERRRKFEQEGMSVVLPIFSNKENQFLEEVCDDFSESYETEPRLGHFETLKLEK